MFDRTALRRIAEAYALERDPTEVRESIGGDKPWEQSNAHAPAARVTWTDMVGKLVVDAAPPPTAAAPTVPSTPNVATAAPTPLEPAAVPEPEVPVEAAVTPVSAAPANAAASASHPAAAYGPALTQLIAGQSGSAATATDDREAWAREMTGALKKALNSYGLQANVIGTRLTPNGCLVRLAGSDRLRVEDIESKRMQLLTTHSLQLVTVQPKPGDYIRSAVKIEAGAKSALDPHVSAGVTPYIDVDLPNLNLDVANIVTVRPERTFWDKVMILHGLRQWHAKRGELRHAGQRVSRHYYDVYRLMKADPGNTWRADQALAADCARHARMFFGSPDLGLETAAAGGFTLVPDEAMRARWPRTTRPWRA